MNLRDIAILHHKIACTLAKHNLFVIACRAADPRSPLYKGWQNYRPTPQQVDQWWNPAPDRFGNPSGVYACAAIGINCGPSNKLVIDDDTERHGLQQSFARLWIEHEGGRPVPNIPTPRGGTHFYFSHDHSADPLGNGTGTLPPKIDVRGRGGYVFAPASFTTHGQYGDLDPVHIVNAPPVPAWLREMLGTQAVSSPSCLTPIPEGTLERLREPLRHLDPGCPRKEWALVLAAIHDATGGSEEGRLLAHEWSAASPKYKEGLPSQGDGQAMIDYYWPKFRVGGAKYSGEKYLRYLAISSGWRPNYGPIATWSPPPPKPRDPNAQPVQPSWMK